MESRFILNVGKNFLTVRAVQQWNQLSKEMVDSFSLDVFKKKLNSSQSGMLEFGFLNCAERYCDIKFRMVKNKNDCKNLQK